MSSGRTVRWSGTAGIWVAAGVLAAGATPAIRAAPADGPALEEVTVTARKREERLLDVPIALTAISAERIAAQSMARLEEVTQAVPNLSIANGGTDAGGGDFGIVFIRGIGQVDYANSIDPGVGTYVDGVYLGRAVGGNLDLPDVQQIEVLRGPQGTLFGKNTMGGAINVTTRRPSFSDQASAAVTFGEDHRRDAELGADVKLTDRIAARFDAVYRHKDGFIDRYYGGDAIGAEDRWIGRGKLEFRVDETLDILLSGDYTSSHGTNPKISKVFDPVKVGDFLGILWNEVPPALIADFLDNGRIDGSSPPIPGLPMVPYSVIEGESISPANDFNTLRRTGAVGPKPSFTNIGGGSLRIEKEYEGLTLRSITGYRTIGSTVGGDEDGERANISYAIWNDEQHQISEELNLFGTLAAPRLDWLLGAYYFNEKAGSNQDIRQDLPWFMVNILFGTRTNSYAAFTENTWHITDRWSVVGGLRYTTESKDFYAHQICEPGMLLAPLCPGGEFLPLTTTSHSWSSLDPRAGLQFRPVGDWLLYATFSTGFKSGGFNARPANVAAAEKPFDMERLHSFEIGAKGTLADGHATASLAAFKYNYDDLQMVISGLNPANGTSVAIVGNLGDATIWGLEGEMSVRPISRLELTATAGYTHAEYKSLDPTVLSLITAFGSPAVTLDKKLPRTPLFTGSFGAEYTLRVGADGAVSLRGDYSYVDKQYNDIQNFEEAASPAHFNLNARLTYSHAERWQVALYGKNLTNEAYVENSFWPSGGQSADLFLIPNQPREIGVTAKVNF